MSWSEFHTKSEGLASKARAAQGRGQQLDAESLYRDAARLEEDAWAHAAPEKRRTRGITAVSAVALWYKGRDYARAEQLAHRCLAEGDLPDFARTQLRELLSVIWAASTAAEAGVSFVPGDLLVSVEGGQVRFGGAPLELVLQKLEGFSAAVYRTVEMLMKLPFRRAGRASVEIRSSITPWLFQAPAGSYQFVMRIAEPAAQPRLFTERPISVTQTTSTLLEVLRASASPDVELELPEVVPDLDYRQAFLTMARNLAPRGKLFGRLAVREAVMPSGPIVAFDKSARERLNVALTKIRAEAHEEEIGAQVAIKGVLRAIHLDEDWLVIAPARDGGEPIRVRRTPETLDDVIGPMVNRSVIVTAIRRRRQLHYRDIELDEGED